MITVRRSAVEASMNTATHFTIRAYHRRFLYRPEISRFHVDHTDQTRRDTEVNKNISCKISGEEECRRLEDNIKICLILTVIIFVTTG